MSILRFVENKVTGYSETVPPGVAELVFNRRGVCLMCGHTPGREKRGACCSCGDCTCCTKRGIVRPEES